MKTQFFVDPNTNSFTVAALIPIWISIIGAITSPPSPKFAAQQYTALVLWIVIGAWTIQQTSSLLKRFGPEEFIAALLVTCTIFAWNIATTQSLISAAFNVIIDLLVSMVLAALLFDHRRRNTPSDFLGENK